MNPNTLGEEGYWLMENPGACVCKPESPNFLFQWMSYNYFFGFLVEREKKQSAILLVKSFCCELTKSFDNLVNIYFFQ